MPLKKLKGKPLRAKLKLLFLGKVRSVKLKSARAPEVKLITLGLHLLTYCLNRRLYCSLPGCWTEWQRLHPQLEKGAILVLSPLWPSFFHLSTRLQRTREVFELTVILKKCYCSNQ